MFIPREKRMCMHEQNWHHGVEKRGVIRTEGELIPIAPAGKSILKQKSEQLPQLIAHPWDPDCHSGLRVLGLGGALTRCE